MDTKNETLAVMGAKEEKSNADIIEHHVMEYRTITPRTQFHCPICLTNAILYDIIVRRLWRKDSKDVLLSTVVEWESSRRRKTNLTSCAIRRNRLELPTIHLQFSEPNDSLATYRSRPQLVFSEKQRKARKAGRRIADTINRRMGDLFW